MNACEKKTALLLAAAVYLAFAAFWLIVFATSKPPEFPVMYFWSAIAVAVIATPWAVAVTMIFRVWRKISDPAPDGAALAMQAASAMLPPERREWGQAMIAELGAVEGTLARWNFVLGCLWASLFPPVTQGLGVLVATLGALLAVAVVDRTLNWSLPSLQAFATLLTALLGIAILHAVGRGTPLRLHSVPLLRGAALLAICGGVVTTGTFLATHPAAAAYFPPTSAAALALLLVSAAWIVVFAPRALCPDTPAGWSAVVAALVLAVGFVACARASVHTMGGPIVWILLAPIFVLFTCASLVSFSTRSFRRGAQAAVWATLLATLLIYALYLPETMQRFALDGRTLADGESGYPIGVNLQSAIWTLVQLPIFGLPFGVFGAAWGSRRRGGSNKAQSGIRAGCRGWMRPWPLGGM